MLQPILPISYASGVAKAILAFLLGYLIYYNEVWFVLLLLLGIVLLVVWKKKRKSKALAVVSALMILVSVAACAAGIYNAYIRPKTVPIAMTEQQITDFCDYLTQDENFKKEFLPASSAEYYVTEAEDGKPATQSKTVEYLVASYASYTVEEYPDAQSAQAEFERRTTGTDPNTTRVETDSYTVVFAPVEQDAYFFNWNSGYRSRKVIKMTCLYGEYLITYYEDCDCGQPKFYKMAEEKLFFDESYAPLEIYLDD